MAQKHFVQLIDDVDGTTANETIVFSLDGASYEIDLNSANATRLREALAPFIGAGRRLVRPAAVSKRAKTPDSDKGQVAAIREWAKQNGYKVGEKGRIPAPVRMAYDSQH
jgi:hypothetical protein